MSKEGKGLALHLACLVVRSPLGKFIGRKELACILPLAGSKCLQVTGLGFPATETPGPPPLLGFSLGPSTHSPQA